MADTSSVATPVAVNPVQNASDEAPKKQLFWGNAQVFENLDKFEQISNPVWEQVFDFEFEDVAWVQKEEKPEWEEPSPQSFQPEMENIVQDLQPESPSFSPAADAPTPFEQAMQNASGESLYQASELESPTDFEESFESPSDMMLENTDEHTQIPSFDLEPPLSEEESRPEEASEVSSSENSQEQYEPVLSESDDALEVASFEENEVEKSESDVVSPQEERNVIDEEEREVSDKDWEPQPSLTAEQLASQNMEQYENSALSKLMQKYQALYTSAQQILQYQQKLGQESDFFTLSWGQNTKSQIAYVVSLTQKNELPMLLIKREETMTDSAETILHTLWLTSEKVDENLQILIDDELLYQEDIDLIDGSKSVFVNEKLNKFDFFFTDKLKELQSQREKIEQEKEKKAWLRAIFRAF